MRGEEANKAQWVAGGGAGRKSPESAKPFQTVETVVRIEDGLCVYIYIASMFEFLIGRIIVAENQFSSKTVLLSL